MAALTSLVLAAGLVAGVPTTEILLFGLALWKPWWAAGAAALMLATLGTGRSDDVVVRERASVLAAVAAELRAGASLRHAVADAAARASGLDLAASVRLARSGAPIDKLADALGRELGELVAPAVRLSAMEGGSSAAVFERLALRARHRLALHGEVEAATAQARLSAKVLVGLPVIVLASLVVSGQTGRMLESGPVGTGVLGAGVTLQILGVVTVFALLPRNVP